MNWMVLPNQVCLIFKLYNNRPELLPDSNVCVYGTNHMHEIASIINSAHLSTNLARSIADDTVLENESGQISFVWKKASIS